MVPHYFFVYLRCIDTEDFMKCRKAIIRCTGEEIEVREDRTEKQFYREVVDKTAKPAFLFRYGRTFHYTELKFE